MDAALEQAIKTGKIPYRYEYDTASGIYFGVAVLLVIFVFAASQSIISKIIK